MRNLIAVAFVEPVAEGLEFPRDDWPLHLTLVKFDVVKFDVVKFGAVEPREEAGTEPEPDAPASVDPLAERIATLMADLLSPCAVSICAEKSPLAIRCAVLAA